MLNRYCFLESVSNRGENALGFKGHTGNIISLALSGMRAVMLLAVLL